MANVVFAFLIIWAVANAAPSRTFSYQDLRTLEEMLETVKQSWEGAFACKRICLIENLLSVQLRIQSAEEVNDIDSSKNEIDNGRVKWLEALLEAIKNILDNLSPKPSKS